MGRPRKFTPEEEAKIAALVAEHGPREAARRWKGPTLDPATATRIYAQHGGTTTNPEKLAAAATARQHVPRPQPEPERPAPSSAPEPPTPAPVAPAPADSLRAAEWRGKLLEGMAKKLASALAAEQNPRVMAALNGALSQTLDRLEKHEVASRPEQKTWRVVLYLPERDGAP